MTAAQMKLLSPRSGWVSYGNRLFWTNDGGDQWTNITPIVPGPHSPVALSNVFFRDMSEGWATVSYREPTNENTVYGVAHTVDTGATWSFAPLEYPKLPDWIQETFAGPAGLYFVDSLHGWLDLSFEGLSKPGKLLVTDDGGNTWKWVSSPPVSGEINFLSPQDGWLVNGFDKDRLYVTHDGCKTWQEVNISPPPQVGQAIFPTFEGLPIFQGQQKGYLVVHYSGHAGIPTKLVIYSTENRGKGWQPIKVLTEAHESSRSMGFPFAITDSNIIVSTTLTSKNVSIGSVPLLKGGPSQINASPSWVTAITFADSSNGWVLSTDAGLLATQDGGVTWKDISPEHAPSLPTTTVPAQNGSAANVTQGDILSYGPETLTAASGKVPTTHISKHLGFDKTFVLSVSPNGNLVEI